MIQNWFSRIWYYVVMTETGFYKVCRILSCIGIALASYLFYNYLTKPAVEVCTINDRINCDAVTKGPLSTMFGVPVSLVGLTGYLAIFLFSVLKNKKAVFGMSAFGLVFCLRLTYLEIFRLSVVCPVCLACQLDMLVLFLLAVYANFKRERTQIQA